MAYIANRPLRFDRDYAVGEIVPLSVIDPAMEGRLVDTGRILRVDLPDSKSDPRGSRAAASGHTGAQRDGKGDPPGQGRVSGPTAAPGTGAKLALKKKPEADTAREPADPSGTPEAADAAREPVEEAPAAAAEGGESIEGTNIPADDENGPLGQINGNSGEPEAGTGGSGADAIGSGADVPESAADALEVTAFLPRDAGAAGQEAFACGICGKAFRTKSALSAHSRVHKGQEAGA